MPPYPHPMECQEPVSNTCKSNKLDNKIIKKKWAITKKKKKKGGGDRETNHELFVHGDDPKRAD